MSGGVTGLGLVVDQVTGYLTPPHGLGFAGEGTGSGLNLHSFHAENKRRFVDFLRKTPHISKACRVIGISPKTYYNHLKIDAKFRQDIADAIAERCDDLEEVMIRQGMRKGGFLDRIAYLKAHRPELYNPAKQVIVTGRSMGSDEARRRAEMLDKAVDAEVVQAVKETKQGGSIKVLKDGLSGEQE